MCVDFAGSTGGDRGFCRPGKQHRDEYFPGFSHQWSVPNGFEIRLQEVADNLVVGIHIATRRNRSIGVDDYCLEKIGTNSPRTTNVLNTFRMVVFRAPFIELFGRNNHAPFIEDDPQFFCDVVAQRQFWFRLAVD